MTHHTIRQHLQLDKQTEELLEEREENPYAISERHLTKIRPILEEEYPFQLLPSYVCVACAVLSLLPFSCCIP